MKKKSNQTKIDKSCFPWEEDRCKASDMKYPVPDKLFAGNLKEVEGVFKKYFEFKAQRIIEDILSKNKDEFRARMLEAANRALIILEQTSGNECSIKVIFK